MIREMRKNKYASKKISFNGLVFDSKAEFNDFLYLRNLLKKREIKDLYRQVKIILSDVKNYKCTYIADFVFFDIKKNAWFIWDTKGIITPAYRVKRAWLLSTFNDFIFIENKNNNKKEFLPKGEKGLKSFFENLERV